MEIALPWFIVALAVLGLLGYSIRCTIKRTPSELLMRYEESVRAQRHEPTTDLGDDDKPKKTDDMP